MFKLRAKLITAAFLLLSLPFAASAGTTTSTDAKKPGCNLNQALDELLEVKDAKFKRPLENGSELEARANLLNQIITCSLSDIDSLKRQLEKLELSHKDMLLRDDLLKNLESAEQYYNEQRLKLTYANNTLNDIKSLAQSIQEWRDSFYKPLVARVQDFYLVFESEKALATAKTRLQKIQNTLAIIKLDGVSRIKILLSQSSQLLGKAEKLHKEASEKMWSKISITEQATSTEVIYQETSLEAKYTTSSETLATSSRETVPAKTTLALLKETLANIKAAYDNYIKISEAVKKILGL